MLIKISQIFQVFLATTMNAKELLCHWIWITVSSERCKKLEDMLHEVDRIHFIILLKFYHHGETDFTALCGRENSGIFFPSSLNQNSWIIYLLFAFWIKILLVFFGGWNFFMSFIQRCRQASESTVIWWKNKTWKLLIAHHTKFNNALMLILSRYKLYYSIHFSSMRF